MCFQSGSVRYSGIWSVLYHWVQVDFVSISELKIQFTPTKMRGWCSGENLEEGSESEIEFQALRIDFSPPLWCFLLMVLSIWLELWERTHFSWMHSSLTSNMVQDNQDTKMWQTTRKQSLAETSGVGNGAVHRCCASGQEGGIHCLIALEPQRGFLGCWTPSARIRKGQGRQLQPLERSRVFNSTS